MQSQKTTIGEASIEKCDEGFTPYYCWKLIIGHLEDVPRWVGGKGVVPSELNLTQWHAPHNIFPAPLITRHGLDNIRQSRTGN